MSSKGRGEKLDPSGLDDYPTPAWCVHRLLEAWSPKLGSWVEPCAGSGNLVRAVDMCVEGETRWTAYEINPHRHAELVCDVRRAVLGDFLRVGLVDLGVTAVITNPPYTQAQLFVEQCRSLYPEAEVVMLLRAGFLESDARKKFWEEVGVPDLYVLPNRPSFRAEGDNGSLRTDSSLYAWFVWPPAFDPARRSGRVELLGYTSLEDRKTWR